MKQPDVDVEEALLSDFHDRTLKAYRPKEIRHILENNRNLRVLTYALLSIPCEKRKYSAEVFLTAAYVINFILKGGDIEKLQDFDL